MMMKMMMKIKITIIWNSVKTVLTQSIFSDDLKFWMEVVWTIIKNHDKNDIDDNKDNNDGDDDYDDKD